KTMSDLWSESHTSPGLLRPERRRSVGFQAKYSKDSGQVTEHRHIMSLSLVIGQFHLLASQVVSIPGFCGSPALIPPEPCKKLWRTPRRSGHYLCNDWESHPGKTAATCCCQHFAMNGITDRRSRSRLATVTPYDQDARPASNVYSYPTSLPL